MNEKLKQTILIVEDEKQLGQTLSLYLEEKGFECILATSAQQALEFFEKNPPSIILMDIGLPDGDGLSLAFELREKNKQFVLLFLTAQNDPETRVMGLEMGAQDFITKPFALKELMLRLQRILDWQKQMSLRPDVLEVGKLKIRFKHYEVQDAQGKTIPLSQKECAILELLYEEKGKVVDRKTMIERIWGEDVFPSHRTVDNYIVSLRKWCDTDSQKSIEIQSVRGVGYKLIIKEIEE